MVGLFSLTKEELLLRVKFLVENRDPVCAVKELSPELLSQPSCSQVGHSVRSHAAAPVEHIEALATKALCHSHSLLQPSSDEASYSMAAPPLKTEI